MLTVGLTGIGLLASSSWRHTDHLIAIEVFGAIALFGLYAIFAQILVGLPFWRERVPTVNLSFAKPRIQQVKVESKERFTSTAPTMYADLPPTAGSVSPHGAIQGAYSASAESFHMSVAALERWPWFAHVDVRNSHSSPGEGVEAKDAIGEVTFYDASDGEVLLGPLRGRWRESDPPPELSPYKTHPTADAIDLAPNESIPHELDVAMKYPEEEECFAYNNANYWTANWSKLPAHRLNAEEMRVRVAITGSNFKPLVGWFVLRNPGVGGGLEISQVDD